MLLKRIAAISLLLSLTGCGITYITQAARGQWAVMRARVPIDELLRREDTAQNLRQQLLAAKRIRDFAIRELALPDNAAYRSYADIHRPYVVWNVVATPEFSLSPRQWCFPVAGCVTYRGYFSEAAAQAFGETRRRLGDDVSVSGVPAYSTLGRFADPLLSSVKHYSELDLAALVFHELAHQVLYVPGDSAFNEAFATAVEQEGVARYAAQQGQGEWLRRWRGARQQRHQVLTRFSQTREALAALYATKVAPEAMRERKQQLLVELVAGLKEVEASSGRPTGFADWIKLGINNAHLASIATYFEQVPQFERVLVETCGRYLPCLYVEARRLKAALGSDQ